MKSIFANPPQVIVWRHRRENRKKCSLRGLEGRRDWKFFQYPNETIPFFPGYALLTLDAPCLNPQEDISGFLVLDGTWRYSEKMEQALPQREQWLRRSLPPHFVTAYPRKQEDCPLPRQGLATLEAIYLAYTMMEWSTEGLLDQYHWREEFIRKNYEKCH